MRLMAWERPGMAMSMENRRSSVSCSMVMGSPMLRSTWLTSWCSALMRTFKQEAIHCECAASNRVGGVGSGLSGASTLISRYDCTAKQTY